MTDPTRYVLLRVGVDGFTTALTVPAPAIDLTGLTLIECAVRAAFDALPSRQVTPPDDPEFVDFMHYLELRHASGATRYAEDADLRGHAWLADLVLAAEIHPASVCWLDDDTLVAVRVPHTTEVVRMTARAARALGLRFQGDRLAAETPR